MTDEELSERLEAAAATIQQLKLVAAVSDADGRLVIAVVPTSYLSGPRARTLLKDATGEDVPVAVIAEAQFASVTSSAKLPRGERVYDWVEPMTDTERFVREETMPLVRYPVSMTDSLPALEADSLATLELVERIEARYVIELDAARVFGAHNLRGLAKSIDDLIGHD